MYLGKLDHLRRVDAATVMLINAAKHYLMVSPDDGLSFIFTFLDETYRERYF